MEPNELRLQKKQTKAFIDANPIQLRLTPRTRANSGTGSRLEDQPMRAEQTFRLIDQTRTFGPEPGTVQSGDGQQRKAEFQLLGEAGTEIGKYDYWLDTNGTRFEVVNVVYDNAYEVRAQVVRYGEG